MPDRRTFLAGAGAASGLTALGALPVAAWSPGEHPLPGSGGPLYERILTMPVDDAHCHPLTFDDARTTPDGFVERLSLSAFPLPRYFPDGVYAEWRSGDAATRRRLDAEHGIEATRREVIRHARETVFMKALVKEMAAFLDTEPTLEAVIEARNERGRDYAGYLGALFRDAGIANAMVDTGYAEGLDGAGVERFEAAIRPTRSRRLLRADTLLARLTELDVPFDELERRFRAEVDQGLDGDGNLGAPSYGMKSYLLPRLGLLKPLWDRQVAARSWDRFRAARREGALPRPDGVDRDEYWRIQGDALRYLHSAALEACLERDVPMQFHAGDGEAPRGIMRLQDPFLMEEMIRFERDGVMRRPKVVLIHAGYPLVGKAAWICHLYPNAYFELSLVTPLIHHGLLRTYLEVMESVPLSKILYGSDAYHLPELYWLGAKWSRRFLAQALGRYVDGGQLGLDEAEEAARRILHGNNREVYGLDA
ncbi:MAG: amidohydrolase family protein [Gemmatimonadota bacterium]|jgi:predicted TIM-barrel fold metal-dependent hydrolase